MHGSCCSLVGFCGRDWCCDAADPKWPSDASHITAVVWCEGLKAVSPCGLEQGKREKKGKREGWHLASPRWGKVSWLRHHLCLRKQLGVQRTQQDHKPVGTRLGRGAETTPACQDFQPALPSHSFPLCLPLAVFEFSALTPAVRPGLHREAQLP